MTDATPNSVHPVWHTVLVERDLGVYGDVLNDILFEAFNKDVSKLIWLGDGRWLLTDCEEPGMYVIEMYPAKAVRDE